MKKAKLAVILIPLAAITWWSFNVLRVSMHLGQSWRVVFAMTGFIIFASLTILVVQKLTEE